MLLRGVLVYVKVVAQLTAATSPSLLVVIVKPPHAVTVLHWLAADQHRIKGHGL